MPRLTGPSAVGIAQLLPYFNSIQGALAEGATTAELWPVVRQAAGIGPDEKVGATIFDMNFVAQQARAILSAQANLENAIATNSSAALDSRMWAWAPWSEAGTFEQQNPSYVIRYQYEVEGANGELVTLWGQTDWQGPLDGSVNDVYTRALTSAQETISNPSPNAERLIAGLEDPSILDVTGLQILRV